MERGEDAAGIYAIPLHLGELRDHTTVLTQCKAGMVSDPEAGRKDVV